MKKILIITFLLALSNISAQSRENREDSIYELQSDSIKSAIGWEKSSENRSWISSENRIPKRSSMSLRQNEQNFKWIKLSKIVRDNITYYIMVYEITSGGYKYPNIEQEWEYEKRTKFFILSSEQIKQIKKEIYLVSGKNIKILSKKHGYITDRYDTSLKINGKLFLSSEYTESNLLSKITTLIQKSDYTEMCFIFNSQVVDNKDIIRFRLPENSDKINNTWNDNALYIQTNYFEIDRVEFLKIFEKYN